MRLIDPAYEHRQQERWHEMANRVELQRSNFFKRQDHIGELKCGKCGTVPVFSRVGPVRDWQLMCKCVKGEL